MKTWKIPKRSCNTSKKKYPIYNPWAYFGLYCIDGILAQTIGRFVKKHFAITLAPKKILLCQTAHFGDVLISSQLIFQLKKAFPEAKIGILVGSASVPLIEDLVDHIHLIDHWKLNRKKLFFPLKVLRYFFMRLRVKKQLDYDVAIDCAPHFPSMSYLLWRAKIPVRIGFTSAGFGSLLTHPQNYQIENRPIIETFFSLLSPLGNFTWYPIPSVIRKKEEYLVIHMGAGQKEKQWPLEKWQELVNRLKRDGKHLVFTGIGEAENRDIETVRKNFPSSENLCDKLTWSEFRTLIQKAALLIGVDTCAGHLCALENTPAVLLYSGIHPPKLWAPTAANIKIVTFPISCSPCFQGCKQMTCLRDISVDRVYTIVNSMRDCDL